MLNELIAPYRPFTALGQLQALREKIEITPAEDPKDFSRRSGELAGIDFLLGDESEAYTEIQAAIRTAQEGGDIQILGYLLTTLGAIACYRGSYGAGLEAFRGAEAFFTRVGDTLGMAWKQHFYAREYLRYWGNYPEALSQLSAAQAILRGAGNPSGLIENMLTVADCCTVLGDTRRAIELLRGAEALRDEHKCDWYSPEICLVRARVALAHENYEQVYHHSYNGLRLVGASGDVRTLAPLYLTLAAALQTERSRLLDARDALSRAVAAGRSRARRVDLALALLQLGQHLRRYSNRLTTRARGSGFLFEAHSLFKEMGLERLYMPTPN
jgi:tetratricopeptide (TPR) repeat protein